VADESTEGAVTKPEPGADGAADATARDKSLDELLGEFESDDTGSSGDGQPGNGSAAAGAVDPKRLEALERKIAEGEYRTSMGEAIGLIRGDLPADVVADDEVEDFIEGLGRRDERFRQAWNNRGSNPDGFRKVLQAASKEFARRARVAADADDRDAVTQAVLNAGGRGASADREPDFARMSDRELEDTKMKLNAAERRARRG